eukprot:9973561-Karenia_brevis.AAC.1
MESEFEADKSQRWETKVESWRDVPEWPFRVQPIDSESAKKDLSFRYHPVDDGEAAEAPWQ